SGRLGLCSVVAGNQLFTDNPRQSWLFWPDGKIWGLGLQPHNGERARSLLCDREALSNELCEAVGVQRASCRLRRKHSVFGANAANDVILRRLPYPASY
ncbi:hypothetical protein, partial [Enterobacter hormaechei]|uniref:hypothetical protein n=1 Tax=Enterobacter hormaechei TaxID=158836 RepID=UPI001C9E99BD